MVIWRPKFHLKLSLDTGVLLLLCWIIFKKKKEKDCIYILSAKTVLQNVWWIKSNVPVGFVENCGTEGDNGQESNLKKKKNLPQESNFFKDKQKLNPLPIPPHPLWQPFWSMIGEWLSCLIITDRVVLCCLMYILTVTRVSYRYVSKWRQMFEPAMSDLLSYC